MSKIRITAGDWGGDYEASNGQQAIVMFFNDIRARKIKLCQLSPLGNWTDGSEPVPFRIAPALFKCGLLSAEELIATFIHVGLAFTPAEVMSMVKEDSWMVDS